MDNCYKCSDSTTCTNCTNNTYGLNSTSNRCQLCSTLLSNCTNCTSETNCIVCEVSPKITLTGGKCLYCDQAISQCILCSKSDYCTLCRDYYMAVPTGSTSFCQPCHKLMAGCLICSSAKNCTTCSVGYKMIYGCSLVPGCVSVTLSSPTSTCTNCSEPEFQRTPINGTCQCTIGHLAGRYCTEIIGCTNILRNSSGDYCVSCNSMYNFELVNSTCVCKQYYELHGEKCEEICGDGFLFNLPCDDGNLINGDGCSSTCEIETGYICNGGPNHEKSSCQYKGRMIMSLSCINNLGENTASIVFSISPIISNFVKSNLSDLLIFNTSVNCSMTNYSLTESSLIIFLEYQ